MTLIIANVVPQGLIFAADRNITGANVSVLSEEEKVIKVGDVVACYAGRARIGGIPMCDWLRGFLTRRAGSTMRELGPALAAELELAFGAVPMEQRGTILHLGGFETGSDGRALPVIWYVRDAEIQTDGTVRFLEKFEARDELKVHGDTLPYFGDATGEEIRARLARTLDAARLRRTRTNLKQPRPVVRSPSSSRLLRRARWPDGTRSGRRSVSSTAET